MTSEIDELIRRLEKEIANANTLLDRYIVKADYGRAYAQQEYIYGIKRARSLAHDLREELVAEQKQALDNGNEKA